jgi:hypothetical protein
MRQLGIIKDINVGVRDVSKPICWFTVDILSGSSLQIISISAMVDLLERHSVYKLQNLNNKPCEVEVKDDRTVQFIDLKS